MLAESLKKVELYSSSILSEVLKVMFEKFTATPAEVKPLSEGTSTGAIRSPPERFAEAGMVMEALNALESTVKLNVVWFPGLALTCALMPSRMLEEVLLLFLASVTLRGSVMREPLLFVNIVLTLNCHVPLLLFIS